VKKNYIFTSESVSEGHPDKLCDIISDAVLDLYLSKFNESRVACETLATTNKVILSGEIRGPKIESTEIENLVRNEIKNIGYNQKGFDYKILEFHNYLHKQSDDIALGVDSSEIKDEGAGDQGIMFGYACNETPEFMPAPIIFSHKILEALSKERKSKSIIGLGPDSKSQVSINYVNGKPNNIDSIVLSTQHDENLNQDDVKKIVEPVIKKALPSNWDIPSNKFFVNPTGRFVIGGPDGDTGLTGRKIIVDTYGGAAPHGGGAFSGKDPTKVDRSAAYVARYLAKNLVASGLSDKCLIQLSYAIGISQPISIYVNLFQDLKNLDEKIISLIKKNIDLSPKGIRKLLKLNNPIYKKTASYGHFGRKTLDDGSFSWESLNLKSLFEKI